MGTSLEKLSAAVQHLSSEGKDSLLIVSGGGKKLKQFEAVPVLHALQQKSGSADQAGTKRLPLYCAYNPYLSGEDLEEEVNRLKSKLRAGVAGVYLQIGAFNLQWDMVRVKRCLLLQRLQL